MAQSLLRLELIVVLTVTLVVLGDFTRHILVRDARLVEDQGVEGNGISPTRTILHRHFARSIAVTAAIGVVAGGSRASTLGRHLVSLAQRRILARHQYRRVLQHLIGDQIHSSSSC